MLSIVFPFASTLNYYSTYRLFPLEGGMCVECGETFDQMVELKRHMQNDHIHLKPYACSICG